MRKAYEALMERVEVTDEMRTRILSRIRTETFESPAHQKTMLLWKYRRFLSAAACFAVLVAGIWSAARISEPAAELPLASGVQVVPDIVEAASAEELSELVGFEVADVQGLPFEPEEVIYTAYWGEMAEIQYRNGGTEAVFRKSAGSEDISGDFRLYEAVRELTVDGAAVTLKGNGELYTLGVWSSRGFSYSLNVLPGASEEVWGAMIQKVE